MSSGQGQRSGLSKAVNSSASATTAPAYSAPVDVSSPRRAAASPAAIQASRNAPAPRNNQSRKEQHKRLRRPRLVDDRDTITESAAMKSTSSRRGQTSITHLMNFSLPPRAHQQSFSSNRGPRRTASWGGRSSNHAIDKSRYVHANYRFIVDPRRSYHAQATNADVHLNWDSVLQVLVSTITQETNCPICLCTPVAPRMAKCGHIFCLPCLIRYMHSTDDTAHVPEKKARWKKCPICWDSIYISDTRTVGWYTGQETEPLFEGGDVVLRLVSRKPGSTLAMPRDGIANIRTEDDVPWYHIVDVPDYARIMKGGEDFMLSQYEAEIEALKKQEHEDELYFGDDTTWIQKAIASINDAKEKVRGIGNPPDLAAESTQPQASRPAIDFKQPTETVPDLHTLQQVSQSSGSGPSPHPTRERVTSADKKERSAISGISSGFAKMSMVDGRTAETGKTPVREKSASLPHPPDKPYYFYQALPHFYLSSLDIRILKDAFGDFSQFPPTILPRIEHISTGHVIDEELRKRTKYLSHLPYGCEVSFIECDWTDLISPSVLEKFSADINRRRMRNMEKAAREDKESMRAEKEEEKRWASARRRRSSLSGIAETSGRPFLESDFQPLGMGSEPFDTSMASASPPRGGEQSFAPLASPSSSPPNQRTVWGTTAIASNSEPVQQEPHPRDDGWRDDWENEFYVQQEIALSGGNNAAPSAGKKKKSKKITLMSTTARRAA